MNLSDLLPALRRGWWLIVLAVLFGLAAALTWTSLTPRTYATSETFFVTTPSKGVTDAYQGGLFSQQRVRSYAVLLASDRLARLVAQDPSVGLTSKQIQSRVHAQVVPDSVLLRASVTDTDPGRSQRVASVLADQFIALVESLETPPDSTTSAVKVELVAGPELDPSPISPRPVRNLGLGLVAGLVLGAAAAVARERLDNTLKTPQALAEVAGGPTLASVPFDGTARRRPLVMGTGAGQSARSEAFRQLRTNVQFLDVDNPVKVLAITSALPAEGKSTAAINLAIAFAETGIGVLLIEADLRRPRVAEYLGLEGAVGLSNVLARHVRVEEVLQPWGSHGLRVLPSGFIPPNPSELLGSAAMTALLQQQRGRFDMVIVDTPPLLPVTDAAVVAVKADGAILVTRAGRTSSAQVARAAADLRAVDARLLGCVLNMKPGRGDTPYYEYRQQTPWRRPGRRLSPTVDRAAGAVGQQPAGGAGGDGRAAPAPKRLVNPQAQQPARPNGGPEDPLRSLR